MFKWVLCKIANIITQRILENFTKVSTITMIKDSVINLGFVNLETISSMSVEDIEKFIIGKKVVVRHMENGINLYEGNIISIKNFRNISLTQKNNGMFFKLSNDEGICFNAFMDDYHYFEICDNE